MRKFQDLNVSDYITIRLRERYNKDFENTYLQATIKYIETTNNPEYLKISYKTGYFQHTIVVPKKEDHYWFRLIKRKTYRYRTITKWDYTVLLNPEDD